MRLTDPKRDCARTFAADTCRASSCVLALKKTYPAMEIRLFAWAQSGQRLHAGLSKRKLFDLPVDFFPGGHAVHQLGEPSLIVRRIE